MTYTDTIGDMFARIRNGQMRNLNLSLESVSLDSSGDNSIIIGADSI